MKTQFHDRSHSFPMRYQHLAWQLFFLIISLFCLFALSLRAATVDATYHAPENIPITASSYTASGNTIQFNLHFAPTTGTSLTVIRNTGLNFIQGEFDNLAHGQQVVLSYAGRSYYFIANYNAHEGRNLVLQWANVKPIAWGDGLNGKLGNGSADDSLVPTAVYPHDGLWGKVVFSGAAGGGHSLAIGSDGMLVSWGLNANGQLGNGNTTESSVPVAVAIMGVPATRKVVAVAAGASHSLALSSDGKVVSWGLNTNGQLGDGTNTQSTEPVDVNVMGVLAGRTVVAIAAGSSHSLALCSDGTVVSWGLNTYGQLGNSSNDMSNVPVAVTVASSALNGKNVVAIAAGGNHSLVLCSDGTVATWGLNGSGQLGNGTTTLQTKPVAVSTAGVLNGKFVRMIAAGDSHSLALCSDGTTASWGLNTSGQLGTGNNTQSSVPVMVNDTGVLNGKSVSMVSAGVSHSIAHCTDGTVATWGANSNGELGTNDTTNRNLPEVVDAAALQNGGISAVISGPAALHSLALFAAPGIDLSYCGLQKRITYNQLSGADPTLDTDAPFHFTSYASPGSMGELLASTTLTIPTGGTGASVFEKSSHGLMLRQTFRTLAAMNAAYPTGTYLMSIHTSTPNSYFVSLPLGSEDFPLIPKLTYFTNATWIDGALKIINPANDVVIQWSNPSNKDSFFQINNTNIQSSGGSSSSSFTIPGNSLAMDSIWQASIQLRSGSGMAPIPGLPDQFASSDYQTQVRFLIQVGTPPEGEPPFYLLAKSHNQVQFSNQDPVDTPNILPDSDLAPYSLTVESPVGGILAGPSATSILVGFHADYDGPTYEYLSNSYTSVSALNAAYPNGIYTFPDEIAVDLEGDLYPDTAKILSVNGTAPVWNAQGQLALDPTIENTIVWSDVTVPNFDTEGHQAVEFENYEDFNFENIEEERGVLAEFDTPITSIIIPKSSMTPTYTYMGSIEYARTSDINQPSTDVYAVGVYTASNQFMAVALKPQTIDFPMISEKQFPSASFAIGGSASSGLSVFYEVISGPATLSGDTLSLVGVGTVTVRASQAGNGVYASSVSITQSFNVTTGSALAEFRTIYGLASDGSQDLHTPANDGVPNLLKYAFNMIGGEAGQATSLAIPNVQILSENGNAGLPRKGLSEGKLSLTYIRRQASSNPGITYAVEFSSTLSQGSWSVNDRATENVTNINATFERVTITDHAVFTKRFARVQVVVGN